MIRLFLPNEMSQKMFFINGHWNNDLLGLTMEINSRASLAQWPGQTKTSLMRLTVSRITLSRTHPNKQKNGLSQKVCYKGTANKVKQKDHSI